MIIIIVVIMIVTHSIVIVNRHPVIGFLEDKADYCNYIQN